MAYDPNKDYMEEMKRSAEAGDETAFNAAQTARNEKIDATGSGYARTNYTMKDFANQNGIGIKPVSYTNPNPNPGRMWSPNINHMQESIDAAKRGDSAGAMYHEMLSNQKNGDLGLGYGVSGIFNYLDTQGLGGLKEAKYNELQDYYDKGFNYDYETDPEYLAMKNLKQKEADKAYKDGYAQLSRSFDGDIPVNMINKLLTTKSEIADQADSYIPQLKQLAYEMYMDKGNQLYNQYNMLNNAEQEEYRRFNDKLGFVTDSIDKNYANRYNENRDKVADERYNKEYDRSIFESDRNYDRSILESDREYNLRKDEAEYKKLMDEYYTYYDMATMIWQSNPGMGWRTAWDLAKNKKWLD